ncbi:hypothetical protein Tco_0944624 [Tanacetum coccineum]
MGGTRAERMKSAKEKPITASLKPQRICGECGENTNTRTKTTCPLNPKEKEKAVAQEIMSIGLERHGNWTNKVKKLLMPRHNYDIVATMNYLPNKHKSNHNYSVAGHFNYSVVTLCLQKESLHQHNYDVVYTINYAVVESNIINKDPFPAHAYHSFRRDFQGSTRASKDRRIWLYPSLVQGSKMGDADINTLTMEQHLALTRGNQAPSVVKPEIRGNVNFEKKSQFMRELREETFSGNKNDDAYEHVERILDIKWHRGSTTKRVSNDSSNGITAITSKLDSLGRDMNKLKENVHAIQVGCKNCGGAHLNKECPLHEEVKNVEEVNFSDEDVQEEAEEVEEIDKVMESLKRIKVNRPLLKEMRQTDDYAKYINNLVVNKSRTSKNEDVNMNTRCSTILQNQLPPKEQDSRSFTLPCSIGKLTFNALANLEASISIMSLSMLKMLGIRELKPINLTIEMANTTKSTPRPALEVLSRSW